MSLLTADQLSALLPLLDGAEATAAPALIPAATRAVERWCRRRLAFGTWLEYHRPGMTRTIRLKNPPVVPGSVELRTELQSVASLQCSDATATRATATLTTTTLTLSRSTPAGATTTPLALSDSATVSDLAAAVAGAGGWTMTVDPGRSNWLVADVEPNPGAMGGLGVACQLYAYVRDIAGWAMDRPESGVVELMESRPQAFRFPDRMFTAWGAGYSCGFGAAEDPRTADVRCSYQAGYDPLGISAPAPPDDLQLAVALTVKALLDSGQFSGVLGKADLGNTTFEVAGQVAIPKGAMSLLSPHVKRSLG